MIVSFVIILTVNQIISSGYNSQKKQFELLRADTENFTDLETKMEFLEDSRKTMKEKCPTLESKLNEFTGARLESEEEFGKLIEDLLEYQKIDDESFELITKIFDLNKNLKENFIENKSVKFRDQKASLKEFNEALKTSNHIIPELLKTIDKKIKTIVKAIYDKKKKEGFGLSEEIEDKLENLKEKGKKMKVLSEKLNGKWRVEKIEKYLEDFFEEGMLLKHYDDSSYENDSSSSKEKLETSENERQIENELPIPEMPRAPRLRPIPLVIDQNHTREQPRPVTEHVVTIFRYYDFYQNLRTNGPVNDLGPRNNILNLRNRSRFELVPPRLEDHNATDNYLLSMVRENRPLIRRRNLVRDMKEMLRYTLI